MTQTFVSRLVSRAKAEFYRWQYNATTQSILSTRCIDPGVIDFTLLSMVQKRDVCSYLVAVKSFAHHLNPRRVVVVCDPSLDEQDKALLRLHIPHIVLRAADEFTHPAIPRGGTWERLLAIANYCATSYVVQLDADTITLARLAEVDQAIADHRGFVIGEEPDQRLYTLRDTAARIQLPPTATGARPPHIQLCTEAVMDKVGLPLDQKYVRGCSGFTGFPPDPAMQAKLVKFAVAMGAHFGNRWKEWGTEQITSNYLVANCDVPPIVLPYPAYGTPNVENGNTVFFHFIGPMRFINGRYKQLTQRSVSTLQQAASLAR